MNEAVRPTAIRGDVGRVALVDNRITAGRWEAAGIAARAKRPEDEVATLPSQQRPTVGR